MCVYVYTCACVCILVRGDISVGVNNLWAFSTGVCFKNHYESPQTADMSAQCVCVCGCIIQRVFRLKIQLMKATWSFINGPFVQKCSLCVSVCYQAFAQNLAKTKCLCCQSFVKDVR